MIWIPSRFFFIFGHKLSECIIKHRLVIVSLNGWKNKRESERETLPPPNWKCPLILMRHVYVQVLLYIMRQGGDKPEQWSLSVDVCASWLSSYSCGLLSRRAGGSFLLYLRTHTYTHFAEKGSATVGLKRLCSSPHYHFKLCLISAFTDQQLKSLCIQTLDKCFHRGGTLTKSEDNWKWKQVNKRHPTIHPTLRPPTKTWLALNLWDLRSKTLNPSKNSAIKTSACPSVHCWLTCLANLRASQ